MEAVIFTFGHSNKPVSAFLQKLEESGIEILVDVRTYPRSRFCPQFNEKTLEASLDRKGIRYVWKGANLGGRGTNVDYDETVDELAAMAKQGTKICVMCSEGDYKSCHRFTLLTPSFEERGLSVIHILYDNPAQHA